MRYFLAVGVAVLLAAALYLGPMANDALAFSPNIKVVETEVTIIEEDEGYYHDLVITREKPFDASTFSHGHGHSTPSVHATVPGIDPEAVQLLHDMRQDPASYVASLRAEGYGTPGPGGSPALVPANVTELPWITDGLNENEKLTLELFALLYLFNPEAAERIAVTPFLRTFGTADLEAVWSLTRLAFTDLSDETTGLTEVLDNPNLADGGGIDDEEAKIVAVLGGTYQFAPELVPALLDPDQILVHEYALQGRGKTIHMNIIRLDPGSTTTDEMFRYAVTQAETIMDEPLRTNYVAVLISDDALPGFAAAAHFGTHITILAEFDTDDRAENPGKRAGFVIAHEVSHYYWFNDTELWIDEGAADFMAALIENRRVVRAMEPDNPPCSYYDSIFHLELAKPELSSWGGLCHYSLGERVLHDLHTHLEEEDFFDGFRAVHTSASAENAGEISARQHFVGTFLPDDLTGTDETIRKIVLARHYGEVINTDSRPVNPEIPALNGRVADVALLKISDGELVGFYEGFFTIPASQHIVHKHQLALVIEHDEPLPADVELDFGTLEYYEDGFVYDREIVTETFEAGATQSIAMLSGIGFIGNFSWPPGLYWVYAYYRGEKIAELYFNVTP